MSTVKIKKAKIKDELFLEVEFTEELPGHSKKDTKLSCTIPVHDDLKKAFAKMNKHLALLCDDVVCNDDFEEWTDEELLPNYTVKGFSIGGTEENECVSISGNKKAKHGLVNLNTPFQKFESSEYEFISELNADIAACVYEVNQYLFEGKRAPEKQLEFGFPEMEEQE